MSDETGRGHRRQKHAAVMSQPLVVICPKIQIPRRRVSTCIPHARTAALSVQFELLGAVAT